MLPSRQCQSIFCTAPTKHWRLPLSECCKNCLIHHTLTRTALLRFHINYVGLSWQNINNWRDVHRNKLHSLVIAKIHEYCHHNSSVPLYFFKFVPIVQIPKSGPKLSNVCWEIFCSCTMFPLYQGFMSDHDAITQCFNLISVGSELRLLNCHVGEFQLTKNLQYVKCFKLDLEVSLFYKVKKDLNAQNSNKL